MFKRKAKKQGAKIVNPKTGQDEVNPYAVAKAIRDEPVKFVDVLLHDEDHKRRDFSGQTWLEDRRAHLLGQASDHLVYGREVSDNVTPPWAEHAGLEGGLEAIEPVRTIAEDLHKARVRRLDDLESLPESSVSRHRRTLSAVVKVLCVVGDTAIIANAMARNGSPLALSFLLGLSMAAVVLAVGMWAGRQRAVAKQRHLRGAAPTGVQPLLRVYYRSEDADDGSRPLRACFGVALLIFFGVLLEGLGGGDTLTLAAGSGLLGAGTVFGSLGAEEFAANNLADHLDTQRDLVQESTQELNAFAQLEAQSASSLRKGELAEATARHFSHGTGVTVSVIAGRGPDVPEVFGYHTNTDTALPASKEPTPLPNSLTAAPSRKRTRRTMSLDSHRVTSDPTPKSAASKVPISEQGPKEAPSKADFSPLPPTPISANGKHPS